MSEPIDAEELIARLRPWLRTDYLRWFEAGLAWGLPRCRTDEERLLFPCLLAVLSPFSAVVAHRRLDEGDAVGFQVSIGRETPAGPERRHFVVRSSDGEKEAGENGDLSLPVELIRGDPWKAAGRVAAQIHSEIMKATT